MLGERAAKHGTRGAIFCLRLQLENGGELVGNDCGIVVTVPPIGCPLGLALGEASDLREVPEPERALGQMALEPAHRCLLVLR